MTITVRGEHTTRLQPERVTVHGTVHHEGSSREPALEAALATAAAVRELVEPGFDEQAGPITRWAAESTRMWSSRPWSQDGAQLPFMHYAEFGVTVEFSDFAAASRWVEDAARIEGLTINRLSWELTDATREKVTAETRMRAVESALQKAGDYAAAIGLGLGAPVPVALADPGMLGDHPGDGGGGPVPMMARAAAFDASGGSPELALRPDEIAVSCAVDARFVVGPA